MNNCIPFAVSLFLAALCGVGCNRDTSESKLAEVDGQVISSTDLSKVGGKELFRQRETVYKTEQKKLDEYIGAILLAKEAKRRGISVAMLLEQEINSKISPVTDDEVSAFYQSHKERLTVELAKVSDQIREHLRDQRVEAQTALYVRSLRSNAKIAIYLKRPMIFRADISTNGAPSRGATKAPVTVVKFEDFQCPYCKTGQAVFVELLERYDGKVRLVHKDLPLDAIHPQARRAAEAARCAGEMGKFWEYHDKLFSRSPRLADADFKSIALELELNVSAFESCLNGGKFKSTVQKDLSEGAQLGLSGTPVFFINGREMTGAQPIEAFAELIDEELSLAK